MQRSIRENLTDDPNKGWQSYLNRLDRSVVEDVERFSNGLLHGEEIARARHSASQIDVIQEALQAIPEDGCTPAFVIGAIQGVIVERTRAGLYGVDYS